MAMQAEAARDLVETDANEARAILSDLTDEAQGVLGDIRRLVYDLRPPALDELGLVGAIRQQIGRLPVSVMTVTIDSPAELPPAGVGLLSMRERAAELGGSFELKNRPRGGTTIAVRLPLGDIEPFNPETRS